MIYDNDIPMNMLIIKPLIGLKKDSRADRTHPIAMIVILKL
jgi:hypothetical protein